MRFQTPLVPATLIRRYKRFLADARLDDGREITAHVANPGAMTGMKEIGTRIWLEPNDDPKRKLKYTWRLAEVGGAFIGVDTSVPNRMLRAALERGVPGLEGYATVRPEVRYGENSRIDFLLEGGGVPAWVEVKSVTLSRTHGLAEFPDTVTARGAKHLAELAIRAEAGERAVMLYLVQRTDCTAVSLAADIDPAYARAWAQATARGVETLAFGCDITPKSVSLGAPLPFHPCD
ncbi:DNA/RNA nuclease SfsA [Citreicella sp. C3M06]|uniref:DNA/RNA nuclease SfsA n=1 Tax=Citreicella sp. C3M06 TaxID=2841564 RepID=UPI001C0993B7|nr:DNA/RNA nuclease SfsA [Citreicella sp. C3M06]MBU2961921.1 DNA/RNA nuclease SfsA [Citreicella sp. C3M06]